MSESFDLVVVGGGTAGIVLATRVAAAGRRRVLLLEAGPDQPVSPTEPNPLRDGSRLILDGYNWDYEANLRETNPRRSRALWGRFPYRLGKVVGGSSSVNGAVAMRALPRDFDDWVKLGNTDWSWEDVLPYYRMLERDGDFSGDEHGTDGPIAINRPGPERLHVLEHAFLSHCAEEGLPRVADLNGGTEVGFGTVPANTVDGQRQDVTATYLAAARDLPNLTLRTGCQVVRVVLDGNRAVGVEVRDGDSRTVIEAGEVVLAAGAVGTPVILQRSGIGPADVCAAAGIESIVDLPGVGANLADHPSVVIWSKPVDGLCEPGRPWRQVAARIASGIGDEGADLQVWLLNNVESSTIPGFANRLDWPMVVGISVMLLRPKAAGRVFIEDADPSSPPVIELGFGSSDDDVERLANGVRVAWRVLRSPEFASRLTEVQLWTDAMVASDAVLHSAVRNIMSPGWHAIGSARMGPASAVSSVVDQECRVHGVADLRVVDASVFPTMPSAPTTLTTIMLAEKIASGMKE